jgi:hypothetical protein
VSFIGSYPVQITCDTDATIDGRLSVDASGSTSGPGAVTTGAGSSGVFSMCPNVSSYPPTDGRHLGVYGSALPFDLAGGSPGGDVLFYTPSCTYSTAFGGGAGGTLVLEAHGRIDVRGSVTANGANAGSWWFTFGSGGSILLRAHQALVVHPSGAVQATALNTFQLGIVRLDCYGQAPTVLGTVTPSPVPITLPRLDQTLAPVLGATWELRVVAPRGDGVFLAASFQPGATTNSYGTVLIDLSTAITFALVFVPTGGPDPLATFRLPVPNVPSLSGLQLWVAGLDWVTSQPPRYTNTLHTTVQ